jgi:cystathionine beta-lyase
MSSPASDSSFDSIDDVRLRGGWGVKWGAVDSDVLPAWVADMDFGIAAPIRDALARTVAADDFGYPFWPDGDPVVRAFEQRMQGHGWTPQPERTRIYTDLIQVLQVMIEHATEPGDGIAVHVPNYPPFLATIERSGRRIIPIEARQGLEGWHFDDPQLAERFEAGRCRMLLLVNPHNPTGRVFRLGELQELARVAERHDLTVLSDEIHADLVYAPHRHIPFASLSDDAAARTITTTSATKAFNIAGLRCAVAHVGSAEVAARLDQEPLDYFGQPSILSRVATCAAWNDSADWLAALRRRLGANRDIVADWVDRSPHGISWVKPEATYLAWLDFSATPIAADPASALLEHGRVLFSTGADFSENTDVGTASFARLNFATSESVLRNVLTRVDVALEGMTGDARR